MKIVFCTTCKNRLGHLARTLPRNLVDNPHATFVVLDYGSPDGLLEWLATTAELQPHIESGRLVVYSYATEGPFKMAHAKNMAHRCGIIEGADILVNLDADNFTGPGFDSWLHENMTPRSFAWACMIPGVLKRGISGRIAVTRAAFELAGGYDEAFQDWGPDDKDFNARLVRLGFEPVEIPPRFLGALVHTDKMRFREYPHARPDGYDTFTPCPDKRPVVNGGRVGCGTVRRGCFKLEIRPIPSKVFGVGMHKTGTTSLAAALNALGFPCIHWHSPGWARRVWGHPDALDPWRAACDIPVALMYRELDEAFPGAKFVLTVRNPNDWLRSVRKHFSREGNPHRDSWNRDRVTHRLHTAIYGRRDFDRTDMLVAYELHNRAVVEYFRDRPGDLLIMCGHEWLPLAEFLGVAAPRGEYPHESPY